MGTIEEAWAAHENALIDITKRVYGAKAAARAAVLALGRAVLEELDPRNKRGLVASGWTWPLYLSHVAEVKARLDALADKPQEA